MHPRDHSAQELGAAIMRLRLKRKMSVESLALNARLSTVYIASIEEGRHDPPLATVMAIAQGLGITMAQLLCELNEPSIRNYADFRRLYAQAPAPAQRLIHKLLRSRSPAGPPKPPDDCA